MRTKVRSFRFLSSSDAILPQRKVFEEVNMIMERVVQRAGKEKRKMASGHLQKSFRNFENTENRSSGNRLEIIIRQENAFFEDQRHCILEALLNE